MKYPLRNLFLYLLLACSIPVFAQPEFDKRLSFEEIQDLLREGITPWDLRKQALAWYQWSYYDEEKTGITDSAFQYLARSANLFLKANDTLAYYRVRSDLADHLSARQLWDEAISIQQEALNYYQKTGNLHYETHLLAKLSRVYAKKGDANQHANLKRAFSAKNRILKDTILDLTMAMDEAQRNGKIGRSSIAR